MAQTEEDRNVTLQVRLPEVMKNAFEDLCAKHGETTSGAFRSILRRTLRQQTDPDEAATIALPPNVGILDAFETEPAPIDEVWPGFVSGTSGLIVGAGGVSKSMALMQGAVSVTLGYDKWHLWSDGAELPSGRVAILNLEDTLPILRLRLHAIGKHLTKAEREQVAENLSVMPLFGTGFAIARRDPDGRIVPTPYFDRVVDTLDGTRLVGYDTFNRALGGLDENSSGDVGGVLSCVEMVNRRVGCASVILHHMSKAGAQQSGAQQAVRGSSALTDNSRYQVNMSTMTEAEAEGRDLDDEERRRWVKLELVKVNYGPPQVPRWYRRGEGGVLDGRERPSEKKVRTTKRRRDDDQ